MKTTGWIQAVLRLSAVTIAHFQPGGNIPHDVGTNKQITTNKLTLSSTAREAESNQTGWSYCWLHVFSSRIGRGKKKKKPQEKLAQ